MPVGSYKALYSAKIVVQDTWAPAPNRPGHVMQHKELQVYVLLTREGASAVSRHRGTGTSVSALELLQAAQQCTASGLCEQAGCCATVEMQEQHRAVICGLAGLMLSYGVIQATALRDAGCALLMVLLHGVTEGEISRLSKSLADVAGLQPDAAVPADLNLLQREVTERASRHQGPWKPALLLRMSAEIAVELCRQNVFGLRERTRAATLMSTATSFLGSSVQPSIADLQLGAILVHSQEGDAVSFSYQDKYTSGKALVEGATNADRKPTRLKVLIDSIKSIDSHAGPLVDTLKQVEQACQATMGQPLAEAVARVLSRDASQMTGRSTAVTEGYRRRQLLADTLLCRGPGHMQMLLDMAAFVGVPGSPFLRACHGAPDVKTVVSALDGSKLLDNVAHKEYLDGVKHLSKTIANRTVVHSHLCTSLEKMLGPSPTIEALKSIAGFCDVISGPRLSRINAMLGMPIACAVAAAPASVVQILAQADVWRQLTEACMTYTVVTKADVAAGYMRGPDMSVAIRAT